ncbi:MAG TPA: tetratricopeptide repeat protein [Longimicrobium sp.]|nr:tetratricopeptide repeat protein [Longimicrobium sp.]
MRQRKFKAPPRKTLRRWRVPPALTHGDTDAFEGLSVLEEVPGELGLVLWQSLRDAMLWGRADLAQRGALFAPASDTARMAATLAAGAPAETEEPLKVLAGMVGQPETAREENVALACRQLSQWAEARGLLAAALSFAQAAAVVTPADSSCAYNVGRLAKLRTEYNRAETWYRRTIALARQAGDWPTYALAFLGLGNVYVQRGNYPAAERFFERALRAAGRNSLHEIEGRARHDLFGIAVERDNVARAHEMARGAFESYGPHHPSVPALVKDIAYFWTTQGYGDRALPVLKQLLPQVTEPTLRLALIGDLGRAAGFVGDRAEFQGAWGEATEMVTASPGLFTAAAAWLDLSHGALSLGAWERAEDAAQRALDGAAKLGLARVRFAAEAVMDAARRRQHAEAQAAPGRDQWRETTDSLADELIHSLAG